jgi:hypothetical protein
MVVPRQEKENNYLLLLPHLSIAAPGESAET